MHFSSFGGCFYSVVLFYTWKCRCVIPATFSLTVLSTIPGSETPSLPREVGGSAFQGLYSLLLPYSTLWFFSTSSGGCAEAPFTLPSPPETALPLSCGQGERKENVKSSVKQGAAVFLIAGPGWPLLRVNDSLTLSSSS